MNNKTVNSAKIIFRIASVLVEFDNNTEVIIKKRKSWSYKKYIDEALKQTQLTPSWDFRYSWELR